MVQKILGKSHISEKKKKKRVWLSGRLHIEGRLNEGPRLRRKHKDQNEAKQNKRNTTRERRNDIAWHGMACHLSANQKEAKETRRFFVARLHAAAAYCFIVIQYVLEGR